ncbi:MAG TPA: hypothetical protein PLX69_03515 [Leptospiraceae bacterium]|nr:hypothetical protein [Leptospiraceae bacterium]HRG73606.1 hypothetical protein [Leptospiraceae bacterium]
MGKLLLRKLNYLVFIFLLQCDSSKSGNTIELNLKDPSNLFTVTYNLANEKLNQPLDKEERISHYSERRLEKTDKYIFSSIEIVHSNYKYDRKIAVILVKINENNYRNIYFRKVESDDLFEISFYDFDKDGIDEVIIKTDYCGHMCVDEQLVILKVSENQVNTIFQKGILFSSPEFCGSYDNEVVIQYSKNKASINGISITYNAKQGLDDKEKYCTPIGEKYVKDNTKSGKLFYKYSNGEFKVVGKDFDYRKFIGVGELK